MKNLLFCTVAIALLSACSSDKKEAVSAILDAPPKAITYTPQEAVEHCLLVNGNASSKAARKNFDACMADKGYKRKTQ